VLKAATTVAYAITRTSLPALSLPCGFTKDGLPVALQMIGPLRGEEKLLSAAALMESVQSIAPVMPIDRMKPGKRGGNVLGVIETMKNQETTSLVAK